MKSAFRCKMSHSKEIAKGSFWGFAGQMAEKFLAFAYVVMIARLFTQEQVGDFYLTLSILGVIISFAHLGVTSAVSRHIPFYYGKKELKKISALIGGGMAFLIAVSLLASSMVFFFADEISLIFRNDALAPLLHITAIYVLLDELLRFLMAVMVGRKNIAASSLTIAIRDLSKLVLTAVFFLYLGANTASLAGGLVASAIATLAAALWLFSIEMRRMGLPKADYGLREYAELGGEVLPFGFALTAMSALAILSGYVNTILLGALLPSNSASAGVAVYSIALGLAGVVLIFQSSIKEIFISVSSELLGENEDGRIRAICHTTTKWAVVSSTPVFLALAVFPRELLTLFYGAEYSGAAFALTLIAFGFFSRSVSIVPGLLTISKKRADLLAWMSLLSMLANLALSIALIPIYGVDGAAFAFMSSTVLSAFLMQHFADKMSKIGFPEGLPKVLLAAIAILALFLLLKPYVLQFYPASSLQFAEEGLLASVASNLLKLAVLGALFALISAAYLALLTIMKSFSEDDISILSAALRKLRVPEKYTNLFCSILR